MTTATSTAPVSGRSLLVSWAKSQDNWVRELAAAVLDQGDEPSDAQVDQAYQHLLIEKDLAAGDRPALVTLVDAASSPAAEEPLTLFGIECVERVNALATGQVLTFNPKITVLFGRNGSGKTGYSRILKRLASVRREEPILPDITSATPPSGPPECEVKFALGTTPQSPLRWKGEAGVAPFTRLDIFDAQEAKAYVDDTLAYAYTPAEVALFDHLSKAIARVREQLDHAKREKNPGPNLFSSQIPREAAFFPKVDGLGASTDIVELRSLAAVTTEEETSLAGLVETVAALASQSLQAQLQSTQADLALFTQARSLVQRLRGFDPDLYKGAVATVADAEQRRTQASEAAFAADSLPGFLSNEWRAFVEAGEAFLRSLGLNNYPKAEDVCVYCRQPLTAAAVTLLAKYRQFCNDALERAVSSAQEQREALRRPILRLDLRSFEQLINQHEQALAPDSGPALPLQECRRVLDIASALQRALGEAAPVSPALISAGLADTESLFDEEARRATELLGALKGKSEERDRLLKEASERKLLLEARIALRALMPGIEAYVERAKWVNRAEAVLRKLGPTAKTLTDTAKLASEQLMNQDFAKLFQEECRVLDAPTVKLDFRGGKGRAARKKLLHPSYNLSDTLSEGEQKVIALADFLAEARMRGATAPVIMDDPVTSLDYERLEQVASRLAALAETRQVIVFTHNIWFAIEILERFRDRREDCAYYDIRAFEGKKGIVSGGSHPRSDKPDALRKRIENAISEAKKLTGEAQDALTERGYSLLRSLCESAVETKLFCEVVRRYEPNVMLTKLPEVKPVALKAAGEVILPVYKRACRFTEAHSQPREHLNVTATLGQLEEDLRAVLTALEAYKKAAA